MKSLWIVPEKSGGIRSYAETLIPEMGEGCRPIWYLPALSEIEESPEELIHVQHEFGLFGSKLPGLNHFPSWMRTVRRSARPRKWVATAHTVLSTEWKYSTSGRGLRAVLFSILNFALLPLIRRSWIEGTWGKFDGVIVHSRHQLETVKNSGCKKVEVIPHFVPSVSQVASTRPRDSSVLLFGYFSPEKGQDVAIRAWALLGREAPRLVLAGGVRRKEDQWYYDSCIRDIARLRLTDKIEVTGYVKTEEMTSVFARANLVIAPFRETSGSGSLATALGYGAAVLASNLPLNLEIAERVPGSLAFFKSESPESLAAEVKSLTRAVGRLDALREKARAYAETYSPKKTAQMHFAFYKRVLTEEKGSDL